MTQEHFIASAVQINGTAYAGGQQFSYDPGIQVLSPDHDGASDEVHHAIAQQMPRVSFSSLDLGNLIDALTKTSAPPFLALNGTTGLKLIGRKTATDGPVLAAGTVHEQLLIASGLVYLTGISGQIGQPAEIELACLAKSSDGETAPVAFSQVAAPSEPTAIEPWILDSISIGGTTIDAVTGFSYTIEAGERMETGPNTYPTLVSVGQGSPVRQRLSVDVEDLTLQRSLGVAGSESQIIVTLKNMAQGAVRGSSTVTITTNAGLIVPGQRSDPATGKVTQTLEHRSRRNGATLPVTLATA